MAGKARNIELEEKIKEGIKILGIDAYSISIKEYVDKHYEREVNLGQLHIKLKQMERSGEVVAYYDDAMPVAGGKKIRKYILVKK